MAVELGIGALLSIVIALLAWKAGALSGSGAWAAALTGGLIFGLGGLPWAVVLMAFFISSSVLSRAFAQRKAALSEKFSKGSRRDWGQVLANGGLGALLALAYGFLPGQGWTWAAFVGAMAAVNADTWSTELGVLSRVPPRLISSGRLVERGSSGGVTPLGYLAALGGAAWIGLVAAIFMPAPTRLPLLGMSLLAGLAGASFDSWLGATVQAIYYCPVCRKETERHRFHTCGSPTEQIRGWNWLNNDLVNLLCSLAGAFVGIGIVAWLVVLR